MEHFSARETEDHWENNRPRCYCGCSVSLSGASSSWWIGAPLCQSCALVEQVFIFLFSLCACLSLRGPLTDEPCHGEEHPDCSHRRRLPGALARQNHVPEIWIGVFWNTKKRGNALTSYMRLGVWRKTCSLLLWAKWNIEWDVFVFRIKSDLITTLCRDAPFQLFLMGLSIVSNA